MSSPALEQLCELVAKVSLSKATKLTSEFEQLLAQSRTVSIDVQTHETILIAFVCANWNFANGVWSNLGNTQLRRDLMAGSKNATILALAHTLSPSKNPKDLAALAVRLDFDIFQPFVKGYVNNLKALDAIGVEPDARVAMQFALEGLQKQLAISEREMNRIVPSFIAAAGDFNEVETVAAQVNRAAELRRGKGFWSRLFGA